MSGDEVLVALCDALDVTPNDLITYSATEAKTIRHRKPADADIPDLRNYRPVRAGIVEDDGQPGTAGHRGQRIRAFAHAQ